MTLAQDQVLVEIITVANLAGIEQAKLGMLSLNIAGPVVGAAAIAGTVTVLKDAAQESEAYATALGDLGQAADSAGVSHDTARSAIEKFITTNQAFIPDNNKAIETYAILLRSTGSQKLALEGTNEVMKMSALTGKDWDTSLQAINLALQGSGRGLLALGISIPALKKDVADTSVASADLAKAQSQVEKDGTALAKAQQHLSDVEAELAGKHKLTVAEQIRLRDAHQAVSGASDKLATDQGKLKTAQDNLKDSTSLATNVIGQLNQKLGDGPPPLSQNAQAANKMNGEWEHFANRVGPAVVLGQTKLTEAVTTALGIYNVAIDLSFKLGRMLDTGLGPAMHSVAEAWTSDLNTIELAFTDWENAVIGSIRNVISTLDQVPGVNIPLPALQGRGGSAFSRGRGFGNTYQ